MSTPAIDVVLPTLDPNLDRLARAVDSLLGQAEVTPTVFVVDDSDHDEVKAFVESHGTENATGHSRGSLEYREGPGTTLAAALDVGIEAGHAPLVARQDADDVSTPSRLLRQRRRFERDEDLDVLGTGATVVRPSGGRARRRVREEIDPDAFEGGNPIVHGSVIYRRDAIESVGGYDAAFPTSEDMELWVRLVHEGYTLGNLDLPLYELHLHGDSIYADQLRETKLLGHFARAHARGQTDEEMAARVLDGGDVEAVYETFDTAERCAFHREMAIALLRYGEREGAREHARAALECGLAVDRVGLLGLSYCPRALVDVFVAGFRRLKNRRIARENGS